MTAPVRTVAVPGQDENEPLVKHPKSRELLWRFRDPKGLLKGLVVKQCFSLSSPKVIAKDYSRCQKPRWHECCSV